MPKYLICFYAKKFHVKNYLNSRIQEKDDILMSFSRTAAFGTRVLILCINVRSMVAGYIVEFIRCSWHLKYRV